MKYWYMGFTVMPQTGKLVLTEAEKFRGPCSLFVYNFEDGTLSRKNKIRLPCGDKNNTYIIALVINRGEQLAVSCKGCLHSKLLDFETEEWTVAFSGVAGKLHDAGNGRLFVHTGNSMLQMDCSAPVFKSPMKTVRPDIGCSNMC